MIKRSLLINPLLLLLMVAGPGFAADTIVESAREIPLVYDVDVVVVGGSTRAVAAAVAGKEVGASVFLVAPRPYLGEDMCATLRLWLEEDEEPTTKLAKAIFNDGTPTPMRVKRILDDALLTAGVDFLYGCYITDVLRDSEGNLAGIVMANRSGRQAVRAKVIIDATDRGIGARLAGADFAPYPSGKQTFSRIVLSGTPNKNAKLLPVIFTIASDSRRRRGASQACEVYEYLVEVDMADGSWASFAAADQFVRNQTWQDGQVDAAEIPFQVPPDPVKGRSRQKGKWPGAAEIDLDALRPDGVAGIYVLGGCADVSREAATALMRPVHGIELGIRIGAAAANDAKTREVGAIEDLVVGGESGGANMGELGELLNGLRSKPPLTDQAHVKSPVRGIPVLGEYDVVVIGGGTGGAPAGIAAARAGVRALVVEYLDGLGGVGTMGRISQYYHGNRVGFTSEIDKGVGAGGWNIENKMAWYRREIVNAGGDIWFQSMGCGAVVRDNRFVGVVVATPHGRGVVLANTVIDATGNAVIPACAGLPCQEIGGEHISVQGAGLPTFSPGVGYLNGDWAFNDDSDVLDMWRMLVTAKHKVSKNKPGYTNPFDLGQMITTRARRRIIGDVVITPMDIINKRSYPDTITVAKSNFDNHGFSSHTIFMVTPPHGGGLVGNVPYRALMPREYDGILVTGLGISAHGDAMPVLRMQADVQNQGYAAGYAAAMAARGDTTVRKIAVKKLQEHLVEKGIIPEEMLTAEDSYPVSDEAMKQAVDGLDKDLQGISLILTDVPRALPLLRAGWRGAADGESKLRYAQALGMLGDNTGTATLVEALKDADWDKGWNFKGMGQYGRTTSDIDNLVIALGRTRDKRGLATLLGMLGKLSTESEFSHCRAIAMALETLGDLSAAKPLADFLAQQGVAGHAFNEIGTAIEQTPRGFGDTSTRNRSLRELVIARALYRCGDYHGLGEKILTGYANDLRGHYATHAKAILKSGRRNGR
ncbi:MAG: FAD-dependent oxidoreductase [Lentisphaeria bacterium]|nr:FAD-dependent oxidoreductase [Lentisphaeria bacterium]